MKAISDIGVNEICARLKLGWPGVGWSLNGEGLSGLSWPDDAGPKPTAEQLAAVVLPGPSYRELRAEAYVDELGKDPGDAIKTIGDVLDTIITEMRARGAGATPSFTTLAAKVDAIKARIPKS